MEAFKRAPRARLHRWLRQISFWLVLAQLATSLLALSAAATVLKLVLPRQKAARAGRALISFIYRNCWAGAEHLGLMRIEADCLDALRGEPAGLILAANHPTLFDAMLLVAHLPQSVCLMRADLMRSVFLGPGARLAQYIGTDHPRVLVRDSVAALRDGQALVIFPEGTRTTGSLHESFKPGITLIAKMAEADIQTVLIHSDSPYLRKGWPLWRLPPDKITITVSLGRRFGPTDAQGRSLQALEDYFVEALQA